MDNLSQFNTQSLTDMIETKLQWNRFDQLAIAERNKDIAEMQAELDRRALEAFWVRHPGERLAVGDKVVLTWEIYNAEWSVPSPRHVVTVSQVDKIGEVKRCHANGDIDVTYSAGTGVDSWRVLPFDLVRAMRAAYLAREAASENAGEGA